MCCRRNGTNKGWKKGRENQAGKARFKDRRKTLKSKGATLTGD